MSLPFSRAWDAKALGPDDRSRCKVRVRNLKAYRSGGQSVDAARQDTAVDDNVCGIYS